MDVTRSFLVRFLGLYWIISGLSGMISFGLDSASQYRAYLRDDLGFFPSSALSWFVGETVLVCIGIYLVRNSDKVLEFLTPRSAPEDPEL